MTRVVYLGPIAMLLILAGCVLDDRRIEARNIEVIHLAHSEIWSKGNTDLIQDVYADSFVGHYPGGSVHGRDGLLARLKAHRTAFPDWTEEVEDTIAERDRVVMRFKDRGTNLGEFLGNPPTGKRVETSHVAIFVLRDGKIVEKWVYPDMLSMRSPLDLERQE